MFITNDSKLKDTALRITGAIGMTVQEQDALIITDDSIGATRVWVPHEEDYRTFRYEADEKCNCGDYSDVVNRFLNNSFGFSKDINSVITRYIIRLYDDTSTPDDTIIYREQLEHFVNDLMSYILIMGTMRYDYSK